jgi:hypothetical protein
MAPRELDRANRFLLSVYNLKSRLAGRLLSDLLRLSFNYWTRCPAFTFVLVFMAILVSCLILGSSLQSPFPGFTELFGNGRITSVTLCAFRLSRWSWFSWLRSFPL